jgi:transposase-like protein
MTSRTNRMNSSPKPRPKGVTPSPGVEERRQAIARYLAGDKIEAICRDMGCSKRWLYKWRNRYQAGDPTWSQERTRRPRSNARQRTEPIEAAIVHLARTLEPRGTGRVSAMAISQALQDQAIAPLPSRRTIYRVLQRHHQEVPHPPPRPSESHMEAL